MPLYVLGMYLFYTGDCKYVYILIDVEGGRGFLLLLFPNLLPEYSGSARLQNCVVFVLKKEKS